MFTIKEWAIVRIDDRLIHGQVITAWCKSKPIKKIQIVDDVVGADTFMVDVLRLAAPAGLEVIADTVENSIKALKENQSPETTMILVKYPKTVRQLYDAGVTFSALNIGGMGMGPGRKNIFKNTSMSSDEYKVLKSLQDDGVKITFLAVPGEPSKDFKDIAAV